MIKFIRDALPKEGGSFKVGDTVELSPTSEFRWIKRNAAVEWIELAKPAEKQKLKQLPKKPAAKRKGK